MKESKRQLAIRILKENACMFNSCLSKEELKHFKNYDFVQYLINSLSTLEKNSNNNSKIGDNHGLERKG